MSNTARRLRRISAASGIGFMALALLAVPSTTLARGGGGDVRRAGVCDGASSSKIKIKPEDGGRIEVEFEVDQNRNGQTWHVVLKRNGNAFWSGNRVTHAPSGSFSINKLTTNGAGRDTIRARAVNNGTGEVCTASASL